ncbi:hypothetical protein [Pectobacterium aroidearum]|uniref:hypothetical protein n=1 Tax=Pectobacterium aroidearum TaxID=1201031 RepID=UPI001CD6C886|nr:hypothetical protein [Pectobacterium aroidearum]
MNNTIQIDIFTDGEESHFLDEIVLHWLEQWKQDYSFLGDIIFNAPVNVKTQLGFFALTPMLRQAFEIRNPDLFFVANFGGNTIPLGGIEITAHSPDGSNVEKRYPFLWAGRKYGFNAFIVSPYMKSRANGQTNKLPNRHSERNIDFLLEWDRRKSLIAPLQQILPIKELQDNYGSVINLLRRDLLNIIDLSAYFCNFLAENVKPYSSSTKIPDFVHNMYELATACKNVTRYTPPSSFLEQNNRWIQIYNTRPDSGHWERGEGQFDSIDGRLMFTLDEAEIKGLTKSLEFWMPQLSKRHAWIMEQVERDHGSKRLRNIVKVLSQYMIVKFSDDLSSEDIILLQNNPRLTLERLDWPSGVFSIAELLDGGSPENVARAGLKSPNIFTITEIQKILESKHTYISTHRIYVPEWNLSLVKDILSTPDGSTILVPRIPKTQVHIWENNLGFRNVIFAEQCTKYQLMAIRQLHRKCFE